MTTGAKWQVERIISSDSGSQRYAHNIGAIAMVKDKVLPHIDYEVECGCVVAAQ